MRTPHTTPTMARLAKAVFLWLLACCLAVSAQLSTCPTLSQRTGSTQLACVTLLQGLLNNAGANPVLVADGSFGPLTTTAVKEFQTRTNLVADGIVGPDTKAALEGAPVLGPPTPWIVPANPVYVALGDSFAAGVGAGSWPLDPNGGIYEYEKCYRSPFAWPAYIAGKIGTSTWYFPACTGAEIALSDDDNNVYPEQFNSLSAETDLVTLSIGGNDVGFVPVLLACGGPSSSEAICDKKVLEANFFIRGFDIDGNLINNGLPQVLKSLYNNIAAVAENAKLIVVGYPQIYNATETCDWQTHFKGYTRLPDGSAYVYDNLPKLIDLTTQLNEAIEEICTELGITFVDVRPYFESHEICSKEPFFNEVLGLGDREMSLHPNKVGQQAYVDAIMAYLNVST